MSNKLPPHDILVASWYFEDELCYKGELPVPSSLLLYYKALIELASADGTLSDRERKWIVGNAALCGAPPDMLDQLNTYEPGSCKDVKNLFQNIDLPYLQASRLVLIYDGFRAAAADDELAPEELEAIHVLAKKLGLTDGQIHQVRALYEENEKLRQKRATILFPEGVEESMEILEKRH